jgi:hypothetical protein
MTNLLGKIFKLMTGVTKNESLNGAVRESNGVLSLLGKLVQLGLDAVEGEKVE